MEPILIVEDETIMRESLRDWLHDEGYLVETAEHGEAALKSMKEREFSLLILDMKLPGKNGLEVLREARQKNPKINGIIITAYPSVDTAVEAMKVGAIDYLSKPFKLDEMESLLRKTLGPVQVKIEPKPKPPEAKVEPPVVEEKEVFEPVAIAPEEIPVYLKKGKAHFEAGRCAEALRELQAILAVAPGNIEARVWIRKAKVAMAEPEVKTEAAATPIKPRQCLWMKMGLVPYRLCTRDYDCLSCAFDQEMQELMASGNVPQMDEIAEKFKELPGSQRLCRYTLKGDVSHRVCSNLFTCASCEFGQLMEDYTQQKLAKLQARREALRKKEKMARDKR